MSSAQLSSLDLLKFSTKSAEVTYMVKILLLASYVVLWLTSKVVDAEVETINVARQREIHHFVEDWLLSCRKSWN